MSRIDRTTEIGMVERYGEHFVVTLADLLPEFRAHMASADKIIEEVRQQCAERALDFFPECDEPADVSARECGGLIASAILEMDLGSRADGGKPTAELLPDFVRFHVVGGSHVLALDIHGRFWSGTVLADTITWGRVQETVA